MIQVSQASLRQEGQTGYYQPMNTEAPQRNEWVADLFFLEKYFEAVQSAFDKLQVKNKEKVKSVLKHRVDIETPEQLESDVQMVQQQVFSPHFRFLRYSQVFLVCMIGETHLRLFCEKAHSRLSLDSTLEEVSSGSFIQKVRKYLENEAKLRKLPNDYWDKLRFVWAVRNCITHGNGEVEKAKQKDKGIINSNIEEWTGISIDGGSLSVEEDFLHQVLGHLTDFFRNLSCL